MKKETTIAILFGIVLGGILAVFILMKNKETQLEKTKSISPSVTVTPKVVVNTAKEEKALEVTQPKDGAIVRKNSISIAGSAPKGSLVFITSPIKDLLLKMDKEQFATDFPLAFGENSIEITAYSKNGQSKIQTKYIKIYYLDEQL